MVNNLELIKPLLIFESDDIYYFLQILSRHKDNPEVPSKNSNNVKNYHITSIEYLEKKMPEIINLCNFFNARAYLRLTPRSYKNTALHHLKQMAQMIADNNFKSISKSYLSSSGSTNAGTEKRWIVDIDDKPSKEYLEKLKIFIDNTLPLKDKSKVLVELPTKSGMHIITTPFDSRIFKDQYPDIEIHKDNPINLYIP